MAGYNPPYTPDEQKKIVDYIIEHDAFTKIKGDSLWRNMSREQVVSRTWQSLKQHFRTRIIKEIHYPRYNLSRNNLEKFYTYFNKIDTTRKNTSRKKKKRSEQTKSPALKLDFLPSDSESAEFILDSGENEDCKPSASSKDEIQAVSSDCVRTAASSPLWLKLNASDSSDEEACDKVVMKNDSKPTSIYPRFTFDTDSSDEQDECCFDRKRKS